jgi:hypothetical protein
LLFFHVFTLPSTRHGLILPRADEMPMSFATGGGLDASTNFSSRGLASRYPHKWGGVRHVRETMKFEPPS